MTESPPSGAHVRVCPGQGYCREGTTLLRADRPAQNTMKGIRSMRTGVPAGTIARRGDSATSRSIRAKYNERNDTKQVGTTRHGSRVVGKSAGREVKAVDGTV
jgi:hypothetical protein